MLVKVNDIDLDKNKVRVSKLDIDDYGSIIPLKELELKIPANDNSIIQTLKDSSYAAIFTGGDIDDNNSTIILANGITIDELNKEKSKTIDNLANKKSDALYLYKRMNFERCTLLYKIRCGRIKKDIAEDNSINQINSRK
jgi:hypothetical protein